MTILIKPAEYYRTNVDYILGLTDNPIYYKEILNPADTFIESYLSGLFYSPFAPLYASINTSASEFEAAIFEL